MLSNWAQFSNNANLANFAVLLEIAKRGKPFPDGEYVKDCFIRSPKEMFRDFKNKAEIMKKSKVCHYLLKQYKIELLKCLQM